MATCPIGRIVGKKGREHREVCGKSGRPLGYEVIQSGKIYQVFSCDHCKSKFAACPRDITDRDRATVAYALADR